MVKLVLKRVQVTDNATHGELYYKQKLICYTLELPWKNNQRRISSIPLGKYKCLPYSSAKYPDVLEVTGVSNRDKILIHAGNGPEHTHGCILVGLESKNGRLINSRKALEKVMGISKRRTIIEVKDMVVGLSSALVLRMGKKIFKKTVTEKVAKKAIELLEKKTGINVSSISDVDKGMQNISSEDLREIQTASIKANKDMFAAELKHGEDLGKTWKDEFITVAPWVVVFYTLGMITFSTDIGKNIVDGLHSIMQGHFGMVVLVTSLSAAGMRSAVMAYINKKF